MASTDTIVYVTHLHHHMCSHKKTARMKRGPPALACVQGQQGHSHTTSYIVVICGAYKLQASTRVSTIASHTPLATCNTHSIHLHDTIKLIEYDVATTNINIDTWSKKLRLFRFFSGGGVVATKDVDKEKRVINNYFFLSFFLYFTSFFFFYCTIRSGLISSTNSRGEAVPSFQVK